MKTADVAALAAISHGTSSPLGQAAVASLVAAVARVLDGVPVRGGFVDVQQPNVPLTIASVGRDRPVVVIPLLLSAGYHVHVDLASEVERWPRAVLTDALGPAAGLVDVLVSRLLSVGLRVSDRIVLACAGSSDDRAVNDCHEVARMLAASLGIPVRAAFLSAASPTVADAVAAERLLAPSARVVVSTYLLAPGYFAHRAATSGADLVAPPLLLAHEEPDSRIVQLVLDRYAHAPIDVDDAAMSTVGLA